MATNTFLTVQEIAQESLQRLRNNLVFAGLVHRDYSNEFASYGDTVQIKKPATFTANDFVSDGSTSAQGIEEDNVLVKLNKIADVTVDITSKELTLNIQDFGDQVVEGAMQALAQQVDADLAALYKNIPYYSGTAGQDPSTLTHLANARKVLNVNKAPMGSRRLVIDPDAEANLLILGAVVNAEKAGSTQALREASLGRLMGLDAFMSQNIYDHTKGTLATSETDTIDLSAEATAGDTSVALAPSGTDTLTGTVVVGDVLNIGDYKYVCTQLATAADDAVTVKISPAIVETVASGETITIEASSVGNLAFHRDAFALVNRPMALPMGGAEGYVANYEGLSVRATMGYTMGTKTNSISFDVLYGVKTLNPKLATRVWGTTS